MTSKNFVKKFKGLDVPEGATHFNESDMLYPRAFYDAADGRMFKVGDGWWKVASIPSTAVELPAIPKINWGEQPSPDAVWIVNNCNEYQSDWYVINGEGDVYFHANPSKNLHWRAKAELEGIITVYRREDCVVEAAWNGAGLPPAGVECEALFSGIWIRVLHIGKAHEYGIALENIKTGEIHKVDPEKLELRPLKTKREKKREAFVDAALVILNKYNPENVSNGLAAMFEAGFTVPKG